MADITEQVSSSIDALTREFNIIAHNLANVSTAGYKRVCSEFSKTLAAQQAFESESEETINLDASYDFSQGNIVQTARPLDFALYGKGFFVIETPEGPLYSRKGSFQVNQNRQIVDTEGRTVAGDVGPIIIPPGVGLSQINVSSDGTISAGDIAVGRFRLVGFGKNENELVSVGAGCFSMPDPDVQPQPAEQIVVKQGCQESSNVQMVDELVNMIMVARLYEANMKFITAQKETSDSIIGVAMG